MIECTFEDGGKALLRHIVVDCLVLKDAKLLMAKRAPRMLEGGKWGIIGGFMDKDETIRQAVEREIMEETGYTIKNLTMLRINDNPNRPHEDRQNVSFGFFCEAIERVGEPDDESTEQKWFDLDDLPEESQIAFDHADTIKLYKSYIAQNLSLPLMA